MGCDCSTLDAEKVNWGKRNTERRPDKDDEIEADKGDFNIPKKKKSNRRKRTRKRLATYEELDREESISISRSETYSLFKTEEELAREAEELELYMRTPPKWKHERRKKRRRQMYDDDLEEKEEHFPVLKTEAELAAEAAALKRYMTTPSRWKFERRKRSKRSVYQEENDQPSLPESYRIFKTEEELAIERAEWERIQTTPLKWKAERRRKMKRVVRDELEEKEFFFEGPFSLFKTAEQLAAEAAERERLRLEELERQRIEAERLRREEEERRRREEEERRRREEEERRRREEEERRRREEEERRRREEEERLRREEEERKRREEAERKRRERKRRALEDQKRRRREREDEAKYSGWMEIEFVPDVDTPSETDWSDVEQGIPFEEYCLCIEDLSSMAFFVEKEIEEFQREAMWRDIVHAMNANAKFQSTRAWYEQVLKGSKFGRLLAEIFASVMTEKYFPISGQETAENERFLEGARYVVEWIQPNLPNGGLEFDHFGETLSTWIVKFVKYAQENPHVMPDYISSTSSFAHVMTPSPPSLRRKSTIREFQISHRVHQQQTFGVDPISFSEDPEEVLHVFLTSDDGAPEEITMLEALDRAAEITSDFGLFALHLDERGRKRTRSTAGGSFDMRIPSPSPSPMPMSGPSLSSPIAFPDDAPNQFVMNNNNLFTRTTTRRHKNALMDIFAKGIVDMGSIREVKCVNSSINGYFVRKLCQNLSSERGFNCQVRELILDSNFVSNRGLQALGRFLRQPNRIRKISLRNNLRRFDEIGYEKLVRSIEMNTTVLEFEFDFPDEHHQARVNAALLRNERIFQRDKWIRKKNKKSKKKKKKR